MKNQAFLDIDPKTDTFFFDSFGLDVLNYFIVQDGKPVVEKILLGVEKMTRTDNKVTSCKIRFNLGACKKLSEEEIESLSNTARNFFHLGIWNQAQTQKFCKCWDGGR